jgi:predicted  nucleic acid-binding Zn ribbon protein
MKEGIYYYVERKPGVSYQDSRIRCLCTECKNKLFAEEKMMFYNGTFGAFDIKCYACEKLLHEAKHD